MAVLAGCSSEQQGGPQPPDLGPVEVGVVSLSSRSVPRTVQLAGRVVAYATAEVRPQVDGIVRKVAFREAGTVEARDVLYELDDRKFQAAVAAAEAALKKAGAAHAAARITFDRNEKLAATNAVSAQTLDRPFFRPRRKRKRRRRNWMRPASISTIRSYARPSAASSACRPSAPGRW
jgi:membrane fusion protein (multidrug efflux system)